MICRMNKVQRKAIICLIEAIIDQRRPDAGIEESVTRMEVEKIFHECFENESNEDDHDHAQRT